MEMFAEWFIELGKPSGPVLDVRTVDEGRTWGVWLKVAESGPSRIAANLDAERLRRELIKLIDIAPRSPEIMEFRRAYASHSKWLAEHRAANMAADTGEVQEGDASS